MYACGSREGDAPAEPSWAAAQCSQALVEYSRPVSVKKARQEPRPPVSLLAAQGDDQREVSVEGSKG
ncbi:MAG TPA: hypothetical protein DCF63_02840 [Planctomycetaceae bacterium]|nr:hypothetical protein [Planctomycetaceae bacterium]